MATTNHGIAVDLQPPPRPDDTEDLIVVLVHELLEAHDDTISLATELTHDPRWQAHLSYLRGLRLVGCSILAEPSDASSL